MSVELNSEQLQRIDGIHNAVFEMCKVLTENENLEWDMQYIGEIADLSLFILEKLGHRVRYPAIVTDDDGNEVIEEYYQEGS